MISVQRKILGFALLGMAAEARSLQDNIVLIERFGDDAVSYPSMHNPLRADSRRLPEMRQSLENILELMKRCRQATDAMSDAEMQGFFNSK